MEKTHCCCTAQTNLDLIEDRMDSNNILCETANQQRQSVRSILKYFLTNIYHNPPAKREESSPNMTTPFSKQQHPSYLLNDYHNFLVQELISSFF